MYLFLLIAFGLAGMALVFLLLKLNLTVAKGKLNALIFYANIIQVKPYFFLRNSSQQNPFSICSMDNLVLGIELFV